MKKLIKILIVLAIIIGPPAYGYYWLIDRADKNQAVEKAGVDEAKKRNAQTEVDEAVLKQQAADKEKADAYSACLNKAYIEYQAKYDEECSKLIMDGECIVTQEKRYELDGYYMHDKGQCEKLKD